MGAITLAEDRMRLAISSLNRLSWSGDAVYSAKARACLRLLRGVSCQCVEEALRVDLWAIEDTQKRS